MRLQSQVLHLASSEPQGSTLRRALAHLLADHNTVLKLARDMPVSQAVRVLGIDPKSATKESAKKAWKALARRFHPDVPGGDLVKMQEVNAAWMVVEKALERGHLGPTEPEVSWEDTYKGVQAIFKRLKPDDVVEVTYSKGRSGVDKRKVTVSERVHSGTYDHVYVWPARRTSRSQLGDLIDYGSGKQGGIYFQATMRQQIRRVQSLRVVGRI